jgi:CTP synthase
MRLGAYPCHLKKGSKAFGIYQSDMIYERHRHRYEFNNKFRPIFEKNGVTLSGICKERDLVEILEIQDHPWFIGVQFHPEFKSAPMAPHPLFTSFVQATLNSSSQKIAKDLRKTKPSEAGKKGKRDSSKALSS